jgi:hypothetical protein
MDQMEFEAELGERLKPKKISWKELVADYWENVISLDLPYLWTIKSLALKPGKFGKLHVKGTRKPFVKHAQFFSSHSCTSCIGPLLFC